MRILVRQQGIIERALFALGDLGVRVSHVAKGKSLCGTGGLTGRLHLADRAVFAIG